MLALPELTDRVFQILPHPGKLLYLMKVEKYPQKSWLLFTGTR